MSAAPADTAVQLPWLAPGVPSLVALTRPHQAASRTTILSDPAAVLLLLRQSPHDQPPAPMPSVRYAPAALRLACDLLGRPAAGVLDHAHPAVRSVLAACHTVSRVARAVAERSGRVDPDCAGVAGLLAPLGWLALAAERPDAVAACLADEALATHPDAVQLRHFGATATEITRRLSRRWELPAWLVAIVGYLDLPAALAPTIGGDAGLIAAVHAAVGLTGRAGGNPLGLSAGTHVDDARASLGLDTDTSFAAAADEPTPVTSNPYEAPLLRDLLALAAENAERRELHLLPRLESEIDRLHRLLLDQRAGESARLQAQKLLSLAEFAAGAAHEINNPLAVISGQAQYLINVEADPERQRSLRTVVQQTQRIHQILTELMQFAKPPRPQMRPVDVREVARDAADSLADFANQRQVRVELIFPDEPCTTDGDARQLLTAVASLLRNAIEASPPDGWARLRLDVHGAALRLVVEDAGPGPAVNHAEHLFDPFFSGRAAGRGRGLGLATAWRLVREHGGDVVFDPVAGGPSRFVMTLPRLADESIAKPLAA